MNTPTARRHVKCVTARCSTCGNYCDDIEWEYEDDPQDDLAAENARLRERIARLEADPREPQDADLDTESYPT